MRGTAAVFLGPLLPRKVKTYKPTCTVKKKKSIRWHWLKWNKWWKLLRNGTTQTPFLIWNLGLNKVLWGSFWFKGQAWSSFHKREWHSNSEHDCAAGRELHQNASWCTSLLLPGLSSVDADRRQLLVLCCWHSAAVTSTVHQQGLIREHKSGLMTPARLQPELHLREIKLFFYYLWWLKLSWILWVEWQQPDYVVWSLYLLFKTTVKRRKQNILNWPCRVLRWCLEAI